MNGKEIGFMPDILRIHRVKIAFTERQIVDGVENIGFSRAIVSYKAVDFITEFQLRFVIIFKVYKV
jgi:hypothetical protein